jgi:hypothetical protein
VRRFKGLAPVFRSLQIDLRPIGEEPEPVPSLAFLYSDFFRVLLG